MSETGKTDAAAGGPHATAEINEQLLAIWFMPVTTTSDWLAALARTDDGRLRFTSRMRYYNPESTDPHDGKDKKSEYSGVIDGPEDVVLEQVRTAARVLTEHADGPLHELIRGSRSPEQFLDELLRQPWAHAKRVNISIAQL